MITKKSYLLAFVLIIAFVSCNKGTPAGFWKSYQIDLIVKNVSDQGPYGGHRAIYWKINKTKAFNTNDVLHFAKKNGWTLVDSSIFTQEQTSKWNYNGEPIFPLTSIGFSDTLLNDAHLIDFPRWFGGQLKVYKFETGWVTIEPGTDNSIEENGFLLMNSNKTEMAVYHLWGE